ncbi:TlpA disulfide reductase family protein [Postechiella marina]
MKLNKSKRNNLLILLVLILMVVPETRLPIQVFINKGLALISPSTISKNNQRKLKSYNWTLKDYNGHILDFETLKDKVVLVNFWATWCPPCIAEMPSMQSLYNDYGDKIAFVFISNESVEILDKFLNKNNYSFKVYSSLTSPPNQFNVSSIPRTFLIAKDGSIVIDKSGASNWNSNTVRETIDGLLNKKSVLVN